MLSRTVALGLLGLAIGSLASCGTDPGGGADSGAGGTSSGGRASGGAASGGTSSSVGGTVSGGAPGLGGGGALGGSDASSGLVDCRTDGDGRTTVTFVNHCSDSLDYAGSDIAGGSLAPGEFSCVDIGSASEDLSAKRYWGWIGQNPGGEHHSLAEFTFNTDFYDFDWYNISFVDAFNLPLQVAPVARPDCETLTCAEDFLPECPEVGVFEDDAGTVTSCVSPDRNDPESPVALYFEQCDDAYAWSGDDQQGADPSPVRACAGEDWDIVFCPED